VFCSSLLQFALSVVAIFGESFIDSASRTGSLLQSHLFTAVINDDLSGMVLFAGSFVSGVIAGIISLLWAYAKEAPGYVVMGLLGEWRGQWSTICRCLSCSPPRSSLVGSPGFIVGFLVAMLAMSVIESAVTATFVSWACDPAALQTNRPQEFGKIIDAGRGKYSNEGIEQYSGRPNI
jgi:hypothetical protein